MIEAKDPGFKLIKKLSKEKANPTLSTMQTTVVAPVQYQAASTVTRRLKLNVCAVRGLGITQIVIGSLTFLVGIIAVGGLSSSYWLNKVGGGVWGGLLFLSAGIVGTISSFKPTNTTLNGFNMALNIFSTIVAFFIGILFGVGAAFYSNCKFYYYYTSGYNYYYHSYYYDFSHQYDKHNCFADRASGRGYYGFLVFLMIVEFIISIIAAAYCCNAAACSCCNEETGGVILQRPQHIISTNTNQTFIPTASPYPISGVITNNHQYPPPQQTVVVPSYPYGPASYGYNNTNNFTAEQYNYTQALPPAYSQ